MTENWMNFWLGIFFMVFGCVLIALPHHVYAWILDLCMLYCFINFAYLVFKFIRKRKWTDVLLAVLTLVFFIILNNHSNFPEWMIRVSFGAYCLMSAGATFVQFVINIRYKIPHFFLGIYFVSYLFLGLMLLFVPHFETDLLMRCFGVYFIILGLRYIHDWYDMTNADVKYQWSRKFRLMLPPQICALLPEWAVHFINKQLDEGKDLELSDEQQEDVLLKVIVGVGPTGFEKVGHIAFSYKDIVFSYGNHDRSSWRLSQTLGDGVYFNAPVNVYIRSIFEEEKNSVFEYGIRINEEQQAEIEETLQQLSNNSERWYCPIEKDNGYDRYDAYKENYPSRLHYVTGAKFYKIKSGKFKIYWALGDNCATFTDLVLRSLGGSILSIRGITSPGTYFEYLEKEYAKKYSPIVYRKVYLRNS